MRAEFVLPVQLLDFVQRAGIEKAIAPSCDGPPCPEPGCRSRMLQDRIELRTVECQRVGQGSMQRFRCQYVDFLDLRR